ncbi:MAG: WD40 repeat domain-containing protein [Isosphaeraceae bacterium]
MNGPEWTEDITFSVDGEVLITGGHNKKFQSWSMDQGKLELAPASPPIVHANQVVRVAVSANRHHAAVALWDGTICFWSAPEGPPVAYQLEAGGPTWPSLSPDRRLLLPRGTSFRGGSLRETRVYDATTGEAVGPTLAPGGIVVDAAFSPDGTYVAIAALTAQTPEERDARIFLADGKAGNVQVWDWKVGRRLCGPVPMPSEPRGLAFRPGGRTLAVVCADYRVVLVDPATGSIRHNMDPGIRTKPFDANFWTTNGAACFSPDGRFLLTWERVSVLHVWNPDNGRLLHTLKHTDRVEVAAFNPAVPHVAATGGRDNTIRVWDLDNGKPLAQLQHPTWANLLAFSPDGSELVTGADGMIRSWDWRTGALNRGVPDDPTLVGFDFTADRRVLVTQGWASLRVTHWESGTPLGPGSTLRDTVHWGVAIPAGDRRAIVGGFSGRITGFDLEKMVTPTMASADEMTRLAELAAGRRIMSQGSVLPISSTEWTDRWEQLRHAQDGLSRTPPAAPATDQASP